MAKFCIVAQGGGMISSYHAGVIKALDEKFGFQKLKRVVAASGAAATYTYLISDQQELIAKIWTNLVESGKFVQPFRHPRGKGVMNIDFLVDEMIMKKYQLDIKALKRSRIRFDIGLTDAKNGRPVFMSKNSKVDYFELLRATCAVPYFYGRPVKVGTRHYYDGTIGSVTGLEQAAGEKNILLILTRPRKPLLRAIWFRKVLRWLLIRNESKELQEAIWGMPQRYEEIPSVVEKMRKKTNIVVLQPKKDLPLFRIDTRTAALKRTMQQGYDEAMNSKELEGFFARLS